jgi:tRNA (cmo5U34)-methyltransferase
MSHTGNQFVNNDFAKQFIESADIYILERKRMFSILQSYYNHFIRGQADGIEKPSVLDLGGGDGALLAEVANWDKGLSMTLIDGSEEMLTAARKKLSAIEGVECVKCTFQDIIEKRSLGAKYNLIVSSLAIHHLMMDEKIALFNVIFDHLEPGGAFFNIDAVLPPDEVVESWYLALWKEWILEHEQGLDNRDTFQYIPQQFINNPENVPDTLSWQLNSLKGIGFTNVDCYYKYGLFAVYGGRRQV